MLFSNVNQNIIPECLFGSQIIAAYLRDCKKISGNWCFGVFGMKKEIHNCGNGFKGYLVKAKGINFCGFCGKEVRAMMQHRL